MGFLTRRPIPVGPALLGLALALGLVARLAPILIADFPLDDGGLFAVMAHDLRRSGLALPEFTTFNGGGIPFVYPPLGLYVLALIPGDPISTERWLPLVWGMVAIPGAYLLARELSDARRAGLTALIFAAMPVTWAIEGGGVVRAFGLALFLYALWRLAVLLREPGLRNAAVAGVLFAAALLTHPVLGPPVLASAVVLSGFRASRRGIAYAAGSALLATLLILPWLLTVISRHGIEPLVAAAGAHAGEQPILVGLVSGSSWLGALDVVLPAAIVGLAVSIRRRDLLVPVWVLILLIVPGGAGRYAGVAWAMAAAGGVLGALDAVRSASATRVIAGIGVAFLFVASLLAGYQHYHALPAAVQSAATTAGGGFPAGTRFGITSDASGGGEAILDWFPALSGQISVGTFQGLEFTTPARWKQAIRNNVALQTGNVPAGVDLLFVVRDGRATIHAPP
jgi:4-amino-4-deoxy-L-arabinose transferase-like glycosyltransferase